ncbi:hypothetical protein CYMTET_20646 [Cymbomonas tetramitiformis]|uniref:Uncharacterized protein n=1 Tax=Cymbomonas tetramitiformis TaxID=36881 RepID=A0AAE0G4X3_9CHLO|nr:hypothetical protein CYMTET_20646 [Cymbomonas tetramitiformis]
MRFYQIQNPGSGLALLLTRSDRPENRTRPEQVYPHGSLVEVEGKLGGGNVPYVRPKDTSGWLPVTRDGEQTLLPVAVDEGMWAYTLEARTFVRPKDTSGWLFVTRDGKQTLLPVAVDEGMWPYTYGNATYVHLKDTSGWLPVTRDGEQTLLPVDVEKGTQAGMLCWSLVCTLVCACTVQLA